MINTTHALLSWDPRAPLLTGKLRFSTREGRRNYFWGSSLGKKPPSRSGSLDPSWTTSEANCTEEHERVSKQETALS